MKTYYINAPLEQWASRIVAQNIDIKTFPLFCSSVLKGYTEENKDITTVYAPLC